MKTPVNQSFTCLAVDLKQPSGEVRDEALERIAQARAICHMAAGRAVNGFVDELDRNVLDAADVLLGQAQEMFEALDQTGKKLATVKQPTAAPR